jgi:ABC-type polysaccharide/polyol phosphate export permease
MWSAFIDDDPHKRGQDLLFTQVWMFMTPIAYLSSLLTGKWRIVYGLNPIAGVAEASR